MPVALSGTREKGSPLASLDYTPFTCGTSITERASEYIRSAVSCREAEQRESQHVPHPTEHLTLTQAGS